MAIEITEFANISITVSPTGVQGGNFGILGFLTKSSDSAINGIAPAERGRSYKGLASVGGDWNAGSEVYKAATAFYAQTPTPTDFVVLMNYDTAQAAQLVGGTSGTSDEFKNVTNGGMNVEVNGVDVVLTGLDFSGITGGDERTLLESAAEVLNTAFSTNATCTYGKYGFLLVSPTTGVSSTMTSALSTTADDLAVLTGFAPQLVKVSNGVDVETAVQSLGAALTLGIEFVGLVTHKDYRDTIDGSNGDSAVSIAVWAEAAKKIFCNTTNSLAVLSSVITTDVASAMKARTLRFTLTTFSKNVDSYPSASVFGRAASVNFSAIDTTITLNLKQMPTVVSENLTPSEFAVLRSKFASAVVQIGKTVNAYTDSRMASGSWLDTTHGLLWLENRCEVDMFNLLYVSPTKIPYTQTGINITVATLESSLASAVRNGLCAPGFLPDGTYLPEGFRVKSVSLADTPSSDKSNRTYSGLSFDMVGAGALHEVEVSGNFSE